MNSLPPSYGADLHLPVTSRRERPQRGNSRAPFSLRSPAFSFKKASRNDGRRHYRSRGRRQRHLLSTTSPAGPHPHRLFDCRLANSSRHRRSRHVRATLAGIHARAGLKMTEEAGPKPGPDSALLQAYLSTTAVREEMILRNRTRARASQTDGRNRQAREKSARHSCCGNCALFSADNSGYVAIWSVAAIRRCANESIPH